MRILVISSYYPPSGKRGSALACLEIVESLKKRGHQVKVLTGTSRPDKPEDEGNVCRRLIRDSQEPSTWQRVFLKEVLNQDLFKELCRDFLPEVVFLFDLSQISASLAPLSLELGVPVCFHVSNDWLATWERDRWYQVWPRGKKGSRVLRFLTRHFRLLSMSQRLEIDCAVFTSSYLESTARQVGKSPGRAWIVPWGVNTNLFLFKQETDHRPSRLLYVGQIKPQKGIDTAIRALGLLRREKNLDDLSMTIAGDDEFFPGYVSYLRDLAASSGVLESITFAGYVPHRDMPDLYRAHDILVFPSDVEEPLTISLLEAMSCGLGIVSTGTGGNAEVLKDEYNALVIRPENPEQCAHQIQRLVRDPGLHQILRVQARRTIEENFRLDQTVNSIEDVLSVAVQGEKLSRQLVTPESQGAAAGSCRSGSRDRLVARAKRWLRWGSVLVVVRNMARPETMSRDLKKLFQRGTAFLGLLAFPPLFGSFFRLIRRPDRGAEPDEGRPRSVLVVQLADLGDVVLTSPFLRELRRFLPGAKIVLVVHPGMSAFVENCPYIDELHDFDWRAIKGWRTAFRGDVRWWWKAFGLARRSLWKHHFDTAISLRWNNDACQAASVTLMYASGARRRIAYIDAADDFKLSSLQYMDRLITRGPVRGSPRHEIECQLEILRFMGASPEESRLEVWTSSKDEEFARDILVRSGITPHDLLIALAPGATWAYRRWPAARFIELGRWLQDNYEARILIIAGKSERGLALQIERGLRKNQTLNLAGKTTLREMASVLKHCKLFVGNDSGPMHVAVAAGVAAVGLYGSGEYERFRVRGTNNSVVRLGLTCNPCSENCQFEEVICIKGISVNQVQKVLVEKLRPYSKQSE